MTSANMGEYERVVIRAILTNDDNLWNEAHRISCVYGFSTCNLQKCHVNVERWLRLHGISEILPHEKKATILIQASVRRWLVLRKIREQMDMYSRLASIDSLDHCKRALALKATLTHAWNYIHSC